jgi:hypothetical protein
MTTNKNKSWDNKIEAHPWKRFPKTNKATRLIIGSFPPNKFTTYKVRQTKCDSNFFYGSKDNGFWDLFIKSLELDYKWPDHIKDLKNWLTYNKWAITDIVYKTYRKSDSAFDSDLLVESWNTKIINDIFNNNNISHVYFTSKWVSDKFHKYVHEHLDNYKPDETIILISPSRNGLRSIKRTKDLKIKIGDNEPVSLFRQRYYKQALK